MHARAPSTRQKYMLATRGTPNVDFRNLHDDAKKDANVVVPPRNARALSSMTMTADDVMVSLLSKFMGIKLTTTFDDFDTK